MDKNGMQVVGHVAVVRECIGDSTLQLGDSRLYLLLSLQHRVFIGLYGLSCL